MAIDRSKFKGTSSSQMVQADKNLNKALGKKEKESNGHDLDEGSNLLRFYPVHPEISEKDDKAQFTEPFVQTFLPAMVWEKDGDGKFIFTDKENKEHKLKLSVKPVFNSKIHGGTKKDLLEEYINLAGRHAKSKLTEESERKTYLEPIYGNFAKKINGITYPAKWVAYADKYPNANPDAQPVFDKFFFKKSIKERLNIISAMETKNDPLGTDPFTDLDEGRAVSIFVNKEGGAQNYYTTELDSNTTSEVLKSGKTVKVAKQYPLSDEQLENFLKHKPLKELYGNCAKRKNFEAQLAGLELFDNKHNMGIFALPEWDDIVIECDSYYPETDDTPDTVTDAVDNSGADNITDSGDEFDLLNRKELQAYAKDNKTGVLVKPGMSDDDVRNTLRIWLEGATIPHVALPGEEGYVEPVDERVIATVKEKETEADKQSFLDDLNSSNGKTTGFSGIANKLIDESNAADQKEKVTELEKNPPPSASDRLKALRLKTNKAIA